MSVEFIEHDKFKFMAEDNDGNLTEEREGSCRKMSMKAQRRVNEWLSKKFDKKTEIVGDMLFKEDQPVLDDNGEQKKDDKGELLFESLWASLSRDDRFEIYVQVITAQNSQLAEDDIYSLPFTEADKIVMRILGLEELYDVAKRVRDANFLSVSQKATIETGVAPSAESSDSAKSETAEA